MRWSSNHIGAAGNNVVDPPGIKVFYDCYTKILKLDVYYQGQLCTSEDVIASKIINLNDFHAEENSWQLQTNKINETREKIELQSNELYEFNRTVGKIMLNYLIIIFLVFDNINNWRHLICVFFSIHIVYIYQMKGVIFIKSIIRYFHI